MELGHLGLVDRVLGDQESVDDLQMFCDDMDDGHFENFCYTDAFLW